MAVVLTPVNIAIFALLCLYLVAVVCTTMFVSRNFACSNLAIISIFTLILLYLTEYVSCDIIGMAFAANIILFCVMFLIHKLVKCISQRRSNKQYIVQQDQLEDQIQSQA